jgi:hypothetical protein
MLPRHKYETLLEKYLKYKRAGGVAQVECLSNKHTHTQKRQRERKEKKLQGEQGEGGTIDGKVSG